MKLHICLFALTLLFSGYTAAESIENSVDPKITPKTSATATKEGAIALAKKTLSEHANVELKDITHIYTDPVMWSNSCLGCAQENQACLMMLVPGFKVVLLAKFKIYYVHVGGNSAVVCSMLGPLAE